MLIMEVGDMKGKCLRFTLLYKRHSSTRDPYSAAPYEKSTFEITAKESNILEEDWHIKSCIFAAKAMCSFPFYFPSR